VNFYSDQLDERSTLRPIYVIVYGWVGGKHTCVDLTSVSPLVRLETRAFILSTHEKSSSDNQHAFYTICV